MVVINHHENAAGSVPVVMMQEQILKLWVRSSRTGSENSEGDYLPLAIVSLLSNRCDPRYYVDLAAHVSA
eukprot:snap_masked-scaffold_6-processed-gene-20.39-mRNA-1 protein AED:1.00 eAED:1.00 QI:0/0/0/0/1/1/2/0/69